MGCVSSVEASRLIILSCPTLHLVRVRTAVVVWQQEAVRHMYVKCVKQRSPATYIRSTPCNKTRYSKSDINFGRKFPHGCFQLFSCLDHLSQGQLSHHHTCVLVRRHVPWKLLEPKMWWSFQQREAFRLCPDLHGLPRRLRWGGPRPLGVPEYTQTEVYTEINPKPKLSQAQQHLVSRSRWLTAALIDVLLLEQ